MIEADIEKLNNELQCLRFEIETIRGYLFQNSFERWVPDFVPQYLHQHHQERYELACKFVQSKTVLDVACGSGFGSYLLAEKGKACRVLGVDLSPAAIHYGNIKFHHKNVSREVGDAQVFQSGELFDAIVSFETIEHLPEYEKFIACVKDSLKPDGLIIISTPIVMETRHNCENPYHVIEWSFNDFQKLIGDHFNISESYLQNVQFYKVPIDKKDIFFRGMRKLKKLLVSRPDPYSVKKEGIEKWNNQYNPKEITGGYQIIVAKNKTKK
jgi:SAM-dependent methyltransferase